MAKTGFFQNSGSSATTENDINVQVTAAANSATAAANSATAAAASAQDAADTQTAIDNGLLTLTIDAGTFS